MNLINPLMLRDNYGLAFLSYVTNIAPNAILARLEESNSINTEAEEILCQLEALESQITSSQWPETLLRSRRIELLCTVDAERGTTWANYCRIVTGGNLHLEIEAREPLEARLIEMARDVYPAFLFPASMQPAIDSMVALSTPLMKHPSRVAFESEVMNDRALSQLFTESAHGSHQGTVMRSTGRGGTIQLCGLVSMLVSCSWHRAKFDNTLPSFSQFVQSALLCLNELRMAILKQDVFVPVRVGLAGVLLPDGLEKIDLGWAFLRPADGRDLWLIQMTGLEGKLQSTGVEGEQVTINYHGDVVIELNLPYRLKIDKHGKLPTGDLPRELEVFKDLQKFIDEIRLGLVLALPNSVASVVATWQSTVDPLSPSHDIGWSHSKHNPGIRPTQLSAEQAEDWRAWAQRVHAHSGNNLDTAKRRLLMATSGRRSAEDVLVDAVIVWENLVGAQTETTMRIASALAWLLAEGAEGRKLRQKEFKDIYNLRSKVVHGASDLDLKKIEKASRDAVAISISALRALYKDRPELLSEKSADDRSNRLLLNY